MPWDKQFKTADVLDKAMHAFWARGYEATSMGDLVGAMGINRASIYATFGNKRSLFIGALKHYDASHRHRFLARLRSWKSPKSAIVGAFEEVISSVLDGGRRDGCLLVNTALELSPHDPEIGEIVRKSLGEVELFFRDMVDRGQAAQEIPLRLDAGEAARALLGLFVGLRVLSRSRPEPDLLRGIARQADALIS